MSRQETLIPKKRGPKPTGGVGLMVRVQPDLLAQLDAWISEQSEPRPSRPEAVRRLLRERLEQGRRQVGW